MPLDCNLAALILASAKLVNPSIGEQERLAIEIYAMVESLNATGGADYTTSLTDLLEAAKEWQSLRGTQMEAVRTFITVSNAIATGADIGTDVPTLIEASRCYLCLPQDEKLRLKEFLRCALSTEDEPS